MYCENGTEMEFSAPPTLHGHHKMMTPEDAYMAAINTCVHMMVLWAFERFKIELLSFECVATGEVEERIDKTSWFNRVTLKPHLVVSNTKEAVVKRALQAARKYSTISDSVKSEIIIEPVIEIVE
jgi:uncharacterized OsmC-like protein